MSTVFFAPFRPGTAKTDQLDAVLAKLDMGQSVNKDDLVALKMHFGELGNDTFVRPYFARQIVDAIRTCGGKPYLTDSNTLYKYKRHNAVDHLETALRHGFGYATVNAPIIIADGLRGFDRREVAIKGELFDTVLISPAIVDADALVTLSHFKGHPMAGFGGAIKNLAMGCAPALGKRAQHDSSVAVSQKKCTACGTCAPRCPVQAITIEETARIDAEACMSCGNCFEVCPVEAININWKTDIGEFGRRMAEYAWGAVQGKKRPLYVNLLMDITPGCDCHNWSDPAIAADIGILGSDDPVALDMACLDVLNGGADKPDKFLEIYPRLKPMEQLTHAAKLGMGSLEYTLQTL